MAEAYTMFWMMVLSTVNRHCVAATLSSEQHVDENTILDLAEKSNKTFLKLIGLAIQNMRCDFDSCSQWSQWTGDLLYRGQFGVKTRSRDCWPKSCNKTGPNVVENDNAIFEGNCPGSYNVTDGNLCIACYTDKMNHSAAKLLCQKDGGNLITIDTKERYELAQKLFTSDNLLVQGTRRVAGGPFLDDSGNLLEDSPFFKWRTGQPNEGASVSLVVVFRGTEHYDSSEGGKFSVLCEVRQ